MFALSAAFQIALWVAGGVLLVPVFILLYIVCRYLRVVVRIFEERPFFVIPFGKPIAGGEEVRFQTTDGLSLAGSYLRTSAESRRGVLLFGVEFGANRWSCKDYCEQLLDAGFDVFTFEFRNHGESNQQPEYSPLQWVTDYEVRDMEAAIAYLKSRPDAPAQGIGVFGISRGGGTAICVTAHEPWIRCLITDGAFGTHTTMVPYMKKWIALYGSILQPKKWLPHFVYCGFARLVLRSIGWRRKCRFRSVERAITKIAPRPLLMIHGMLDTYITPEITRSLFARAKQPKELWLVEKAKHNQALQAAGAAYGRRLVGFFTEHLNADGAVADPTPTDERKQNSSAGAVQQVAG